MSSATSSPMSVARRHELVEVVERAELARIALVAAVGGADRPRAADVVGPGDERVVAALAAAAADRVDRREVQHVETHVLDIGQPGLAVVEGAVARRIVGSRARKKFVPGREAGPFALDGQRIDALVGPGVAQVGVLLGGIAERLHRDRASSARRSPASRPLPPCRVRATSAQQLAHPGPCRPRSAAASISCAPVSAAMRTSSGSMRRV